MSHNCHGIIVFCGLQRAIIYLVNSSDVMCESLLNDWMLHCMRTFAVFVEYM